MSQPPTVTVPTDSLAYADLWMDKLRQHLPETVRTWDADAVHQSRVATRRLKAALAVAEPVLTKHHRKPLASVLRKLRRRLGPLRDLDVMVDHLADFKPSAGVDWLRSQLEAERAGRREAVADKLDVNRSLAKLGAWWAVRQEWAEAGDEAVGGLTADAVHLQLDAFAERAVASGGDPHQVRLAAKALRYTLEMAVAAGHPLPADVGKAFKRMQDALGAWHDMVVLAHRATRAAVDAGLALHDAAMFLSVTDVARSAAQRSQRHLSAFADLWQKRGGTLAETIRGTFPISLAITESQTGPDRPGSAGTPDPEPPPPANPAAG